VCVLLLVQNESRLLRRAQKKPTLRVAVNSEAIESHTQSPRKTEGKALA